MARRQVISGPDLPSHGDQPIPTAVRVDRMVFSSALAGVDPATHAVPSDPRQQIGHAFANMRRVIERAGGTVDDIAKVSVYLSDMQHRALVNEAWVEMFPRTDDRPVRHTVRLPMQGERVIQVEFIAVLGGAGS